jgi:hypothetical protein
MKRQALLLEGNLAPPPPVSVFVGALKKWLEKRTAPKRSDPLHGPAFVNEAGGQPSGTKNLEVTATKSALRFNDLTTELGTEYEGLDAWLLAMSRWMMQAQLMFDDPREAEAFHANRIQKKPPGYKLYQMSANSFRGYLNGIGRAYNETDTQPFIMMSSLKQFPETNRFMRAALTREALRRSLNVTHSNYDDHVLTENELPRLREATDFQKPLQVQRCNQTILAYRTGFRPEMLRRLKVGSVRIDVDAQGRKVMTIILGSMKQLVQDLTKCDLALFQCPIVQASNPMFCPVAAVERQIQLLKNVGGLDGTEKDADKHLFRAVHTWSNSMKDAAPSTEAFRGVADWVSTTLGVKRQFRDIGRRAAMTRLANAEGFSTVEVAKYFGVTVNTVMKYHKQGRATSIRAASVLSGVDLHVKGEVKNEGEANPSESNPVHVPQAPDVGLLARYVMCGHVDTFHANSHFQAHVAQACGETPQSEACTSHRA